MERINGMLGMLVETTETKLGPVQTSNFVCTKLNTYLGQDPNDNNSTVNSGIELNQSDLIHFHDVQWSTMLSSEMNSVIYALVSAHEISKFEV